MTPFQKLISAAYRLFTRQNGSPMTNDSLCEMRQYLNQVTKAELNIDPCLLHDTIPTKNEAPVTYIRVIEDRVMTVAMFILRQGKRLPMHDHPKMTGLLKVLHGNLTIKTYTPLGEKYPVPESLQDQLQQKYGRRIPVYPVKYEGENVWTESDECITLTQDGKNIHEIHAESGTAAFLDVLSPPYNNQKNYLELFAGSKSSANQDYRPCSYYMEVDADKQDSTIRYLVKIKAPDDYWCNEADYLGPPVPKPL